MAFMGFLMSILGYEGAAWILWIGVGTIGLAYIIWIAHFFVERAKYSSRQILRMVTFEISAISFAMALIGKVFRRSIPFYSYADYLIILGIASAVGYFILIYSVPKQPQIYDLDIFKDMKDDTPRLPGRKEGKP